MRLNLCARIGLMLTVRIDQCLRTGHHADCDAGGYNASQRETWDSPRCAASNGDSPRARGFWNTLVIRR